MQGDIDRALQLLTLRVHGHHGLEEIRKDVALVADREPANERYLQNCV
jgi:hypothetical protein